MAPKTKEISLRTLIIDASKLKKGDHLNLKPDEIILNANNFVANFKYPIVCINKLHRKQVWITNDIFRKQKININL